MIFFSFLMFFIFNSFLSVEFIRVTLINEIPDFGGTIPSVHCTACSHPESSLLLSDWSPHRRPPTPPAIHMDFFNKYLHCFRSVLGSLWLWRADCMNCSTPFYRAHLTICGFCYPEGALQPMPHRNWGATSVLGWSKVTCGFLSAPPTLFKGQLYSNNLILGYIVTFITLSKKLFIISITSLILFLYVCSTFWHAVFLLPEEHSFNPLLLL